MGQFSRILLFLFFSFEFCSSSSSFPSFSANTSVQLCSHYDRLSLIEFKNSFSQYKGDSPECPASYSKTETWKKGMNCCSWDGVTCDNVTGRVIGLDLSCSWLYGGSLHSNSSLFRLSYLQKLNLDDVVFLPGSIPAAIGNLLQLTHFQAKGNNFSGRIPSSLTNLSKLQVVLLPDNKLVGPLPPNLSNLSKLVRLDLSSNSLNGIIPSSLYNFPSLQYLDLSYNQLTGPINEFQSQSLEVLLLDHNQLNGSLPSSIFKLVNLTFLDLSSNSFSGTLDASFKLRKLKYLSLSYNRLSFTTNTIVNHTFPYLRSLYLASCNVTEFPYFLRGSKLLHELDLSNNRLYDQVPDWMLEVGIDTLFVLKLANNSLTGIKQIPWKSLWYLNLHSNLLQGLLPIPTALNYYIISNNKLTGEIPSSICNVRLKYLDLSNNSISGTIPSCFNRRFKLINLRGNKLSGPIPDFCHKRNFLGSLNLNGNQLEGPLPRSLMRCELLNHLDVGNNQINDTFPNWLENLTNLQILVLKSNNFHGSIEDCKHSHCFSKLHIFDISNNEFSGPLPVKYFENMQAMMKSSGDLIFAGIDGSYEVSMSMAMKGREYQLVRITKTFKIIDFSNNKFQGEILNVIGKLTDLKGLNFSHNNIGGGIPSSLENLRNLEWLDLSSNMLIGNIPEPLKGLTFLSHLNLSHNKLVGPIPRSRQFDTFDNSSYEGNSGLCGFPLSKTCGNDGVVPQSPPLHGEEDDSQSELDWKIIMMGYSSGVVIGLSLGYIVFATGKPQWFVRLVERNCLKQAKRPNQTRRRSRN